MNQRISAFLFCVALFALTGRAFGNSEDISETESEIKTEIEIRKSITDVETSIEKAKALVKAKSVELLRAQQKVPAPRFLWEDEDSSTQARAVLLKYRELEMKSLLRQLEILDQRKGELQGDLELLQLRALEESKVNAVTATAPKTPAKILNKAICLQTFAEPSAERMIVSQRFGLYQDKETGLSWNNAGWWVTGIRDEVRACAPGIVVYVGKITGRGRVVLIDHGNAAMTLYANMADDVSSTLTRGTKVVAGSPIGSVGEKLYFEIRQQGEAVDPKIALSSQLLQRFQF